ncbi:MAG: transposase [Sphingomonadales bacterium]|nr:transposase [Sphingomonadales bacterium]
MGPWVLINARWYEAQILIEAWRRHYNTVRPHSWTPAITMVLAGRPAALLLDLREESILPD